MVQLKVAETTPDFRGEIHLFVCVPSHGLTDGKRLMACGSEINRSDETVEPSRKENDAILRGADRLARRSRQ
ncbi:hypothetical protein FRZ61_32130 [Hypericibacter adhaerens]|uniref:Uncharacterized protein n=1 Tax=Hypericibacter adhaerens TaxID=2602016 RepID=A0A5J6N1B1_9PROT|nr:hypothetical protein FRZ61_32130 [Hypericibacter adhaerens]